MLLSGIWFRKTGFSLKQCGNDKLGNATNLIAGVIIALFIEPIAQIPFILKKAVEKPLATNYHECSRIYKTINIHQVGEA
jgi:hypothetical protein